MKLQKGAPARVEQEKKMYHRDIYRMEYSHFVKIFFSRAKLFFLQTQQQQQTIPGNGRILSHVVHFQLN